MIYYKHKKGLAAPGLIFSMVSFPDRLKNHIRTPKGIRSRNPLFIFDAHFEEFQEP